MASTLNLADWDIVLETWFPSQSAFEARYETAKPGENALAAQWREKVKEESMLRVSPSYAWPARAPTPEENHVLTYMSLLRWKQIPAEEVARHWREHVDVAREVHKGAARYERNWVDSILTEDLRGLGGITDMSFKTIEDFRDRYWNSPEGARAVVDDVKDFVGGFQRLYLTGRHVLRH
jgi:hypothetical protein